MSRVQVEEIAPVRPPQPVQITGDTYSGAPKPVIDNNLDRLASALGQFSGTVAQIANRRPQNDPREAEVRWYLSRTSDDQLRQDVMGGRVQHWDVPQYRELYTTNLAQREARRLFADVSAAVASGEIPSIGPNGEHVDIWPLVQQRVGAAFENAGPLARDPNYAKVFQETFESRRKELDDAAVKRRGEWANQSFRGIAESAMDNVVANALNPEVKDADLAKRWMDLKGSLTTRFGRPRQELDDIMVGRLKNLADKDPEAADRILRLDRGNGVGSMISDPRMREAINPLLEQIRNARKERFDRDAQEKAGRDALGLLDRGDQSFNAVQDVEYVNPHDPANPRRVLKADEARERALMMARARTEQNLQRQGADPEVAAKEVFEQDAQRYIGSNVPNRAWSQTITDVGRVLGNPAAATQPENVQRLLAAQQLYENLNAKNPGYVKETLRIGEREEKLFQMARMYQTLRGDPPDVAMRSATTTLLNSTPEFDRAARDRVQAVTNAMGDGWLPFDAVTINNRPMLRQQVVALATAIAQDTSINPEDAVKAAGRIVSERIVTINGQSVIGSPFVTQQNREAWNVRLQEVFQQNPVIQGMDGRVTDWRKLSIRPMAQDPSKFHVVDDKGLPVTSVTVDGDGKTVRRSLLTISAPEIRMIEGNLRQRQEEIVLREQQLAAVRRQGEDALPNSPERLKAMEGEREIVDRQDELAGRGNEPSSARSNSRRNRLQLTPDAPQADRRGWQEKVREGMRRQGFSGPAAQEQAQRDYDARRGNN